MELMGKLLSNYGGLVEILEDLVSNSPLPSVQGEASGNFPAGIGD